MIKVPENRTVYIRGKKFVEGETLPGGVFIEFEKKPVKKTEKQSEFFNEKESD